MNNILMALGPGLGQIFSPKIQEFPTEDYDGLEFRYGRWTLRPALFKTEGLILGVIFAYLIIGLIGTSLNKSKAKSWIKAQHELLTQQFALPGDLETLLSDGPTDFLFFSTGRRAVHYLQTFITLFPRHDILYAAWEFGWSMIDLQYQPHDTITLKFRLSTTATPGFVWALVSKYQLKDIRKKRFDVIYFTKMAENSALPPTIAVMSESAEITDILLKSQPGQKLVKLVTEPDTGRYFESLVITDGTEGRPLKGPIPADRKERWVLLTLALPPASANGATVPLIQTTLDLIDFLDSKPPIRDDITKKLIKVRTDLDAQLLKEATEPSEEEKEAAEEAKRAAKRKADEDKFAAMSPAEQRKYEEKERKKALRKASGKAVFK